MRDYGFIESFPQEWTYELPLYGIPYRFMLDRGDPDGGNGESNMTVRWETDMQPPERERGKFVAFLKQQVRRLRKIRHMAKHDHPNIEETVPPHQLELIWDFVDANIVALKSAIESIENGALRADDDDKTEGDEEYSYEKAWTCSNDVTIANGSHYDELGDEYYEIVTTTSDTCENSHIMEFTDWDSLEDFQTNYQALSFMESEDGEDLCMDIEDIVQICNSYRPQYHEYVVHAAARYIDDVKRIVFIGGGDSMILHEALKYPNLELVVGLELDQTVVRKSFKHFKTRPHFDDDRVEWWFGDATKSLLLLEEDYWQSFDLVLVDLSETVMSLSVTDELDVFDALTLLLKPSGVMVKNELYFTKFSEIFDYSSMIVYQSPIICSQAMVMGSNAVDFFAATPKDHGVETLLYEPMVTKSNKHDFLHDFGKNDARSQGKCGDSVPEVCTEQTTAAGIIAIVNAEEASVPLDDGQKVAGIIRAVIDAQGFSLLSDPIFAGGSVYGVMKEGYVAVRLWPDEKYCAFDINLWGSFHKSKNLQAALVEAVGSALVSSYRVILGGMFGSSTWEEDKSIIGPKAMQMRNCAEPPVPTDPTVSPEDVIEVALKESTALSSKNRKLKFLVFCETTDCQASDSLRDNEKVKSIGEISTCAGLDDDKVSDEIMHECEIKTLAKLKAIVGDSYHMPDILVIDASVPYRMLQVLNSILADDKDRKGLIQKKVVFISLSTNQEDDIRRQQFLDRYHKWIREDSVFSASIILKGGKTKVGFSLVADGDEKIAYKVDAFASNVQKTFEGMGKDVTADVQSIAGGELAFIDDWDPPTFLASDYDEKPSTAIFEQQKALGRQNIFQLVPAPGVEDIEMSTATLKAALESGIKQLNFEVRSHQEFVDVGDGAVEIFVYKEGSVIGVWDGRNHVDVNFFTYEESPGLPEAFIDAVISFTGGKVMKALRDDQPRGVGRVINFPSDLGEEARIAN